MTRCFFLKACAIFLFCGVADAWAGAEHLPADVRAALAQTNNFRSAGSVTAIPDSARVAFARAVRDPSFAMAEPGAKWQSTDVILEQGLPWRRLQAVAVSPEWLVLFYEHGGIGRSYHVCVFRVKADGAELVWRANRARTVVSLDELNRAIDSGDVRDDPKFAF